MVDKSREVLVEALKDVEEAGVPDDLREVAFTKAFDLRACAVVPPPGPAAPAVSQQGRPALGQSPDDPLAAIADRVKMQRETVAEVFSIVGGELELITPPGKLNARTATATKEIALLIAGGRQAAGIEEWTAWDEFRKVCAEFKKLDSGNFAKTIREMDDVFNFRKESERKNQAKLARPGWDEFATIVRRLGGE